jgi:hypothetical protein
MHSGGDPAAAAAAAQSAAQRRQRHWTMASESGALAVRTSTGDFFSHARPGLAGGGGQHFSFTPRAHFICGDERGGGATAPMCRHGPARRGQHAPDGGDHGPFAHGGLGHSGDASLIFEDLRLPHPPMRGPERYVVRQLLSRSVDLGLGDVLASRAEQLLRVHEVSARGLEAGREVRKVAVVQAALLGVGVGLAQAVIEDLVGGPALAVVLGWVGGNAEGTGAAAAVQVELDGTFWLHLCILLGSLLLTVAVEMLLLLKIVLHAASKQISLLGVDLSASMASRSKQATTAATMGGEQQQQPFARAVARAVLGLEDEGCVIKLGVSPRPDTGWYAWLRCRTPGCRERSSAAYWLRLVVFVLFKQVLAKTCLRALVPAVSLPLFAVLNFLLVDAQLKVRLAVSPPCVNNRRRGAGGTQCLLGPGCLPCVLCTAPALITTLRSANPSPLSPLPPVRPGRRDAALLGAAARPPHGLGGGGGAAARRAPSQAPALLPSSGRPGGYPERRLLPQLLSREGVCAAARAPSLSVPHARVCLLSVPACLV